MKRNEYGLLGEVDQDDRADDYNWSDDGSNMDEERSSDDDDDDDDDDSAGSSVGLGGGGGKVPKIVFVIGATNRPDLLDSSLLRPGRFDRLLYLGIASDPSARERVLQAVTRSFPLAPEMQAAEKRVEAAEAAEERPEQSSRKDVVSGLAAVAQALPGTFSGADTAAVASAALGIAIRRRIQALEDEVKELNKMRRGGDIDGGSLSEDILEEEDEEEGEEEGGEGDYGADSPTPGKIALSELIRRYQKGLPPLAEQEETDENGGEPNFSGSSTDAAQQSKKQKQARKAYFKGRLVPQVSMEDFAAAAATVAPSVSSAELRHYEDLKRRFCSTTDT